jgi:integrase/recombinase XerD
VERILAQPDVHTPMGLRDRAMLEVFYSTGMRHGEEVRLGCDDVDAARRRGDEESSTLFLGARGDRIRPSRLTERMHRYVSAASGKPGSCHVFRHSMATLMHDGDADIRDLQEMLGHAQISTTEIYTHVSVERLRSVHALTHPAEAGRAWLGRRVGGGVAPLLAVPPRRGRLKGPWGAAGGSG